ncbi:MAG: vitamin K epoxide reductase family protein [Aggregatilineales bacterium]
MASVITQSGVNTQTADAKPRPWLKWMSILVALAGTADATYLTYSHFSGIATVCPEVTSAFKCDLVQNSYYSTIAGFPIVLLGLGGYLAVLAVLLLDGRAAFFTRHGALLAFGLTLLGFLYSGFLTATEAFTLHAWCIWCLGSAIIMTCLFVLSATRTWRQIGAVSYEDDDLDEAADA